MKLAKPGDTIRITKQNSFHGREFLVIKCPDDKKNGGFALHTWVECNGITRVVLSDGYEIVTPSNGKDVDVFLRKQLNNNLASVLLNVAVGNSL